MHSNIFIIQTAAAIEPDWADFKLSLEEIIENFKPEAADYVNDGNIGEDMEIFKEWFCTAEKILEDGTAYKVNTKEFLQAVRKHNQEAIESMKELISKPNPNLWEISNTAYPRNQEFFIVNGGGLYNEFNLEGLLEDSEYFYIINSFDYHY